MAGDAAAPSPESGVLIRALAAHPEQMADLIEALHVRVFDAASLLDLMGRVSREAVRLLAGVGWAGVTAQFDGMPLTAAHTDARMLVVDERQYTGQDGPCLRALRTGVPVAMTLADVAREWPPLAVTAQQVGVQSFLAVPLFVDGQSVAALNLYGYAGDIPAPDTDFLTVLCMYAGRGLRDFKAAQPAAAGESLRAAVAEWSLVEQAIGMLMQMHGFSADYAADVLADQAQDWHRTVREQASYIINNQIQPN